MDDLFDTYIQKLNDWADTVGARVEVGSGLDDDSIEIFPQLITPFFGEFCFSIPPSYKTFLRAHGSLAVLFNYGDATEPDWARTQLCNVYSPEEIIAARGWVLIPQGVTLGADERPITTNHLVAFGASDASNSHWCFLTDKQNQDDELPVLAHCVDEPSEARYIDTGEYVDPDYVSLAYESFADWFAATVTAVCLLDPDELSALV